MGIKGSSFKRRVNFERRDASVKSESLSNEEGSGQEDILVFFFVGQR